MSRRNTLAVLVAVVVSAICYLRADRNPYSRYLTQALFAINRWALEPASQSDLFDGAMRGMVGRLDEHSFYISSEEAEEFETNLDQEFGGIGVMLQLEGDQEWLTVVSPPLPGTPAFKAGIRANDRILEIDGQSTLGMTMRDVLRKMRGRQGDPVVLAILSSGEDGPETYTMVRETINIPSILGAAHNASGSWNYVLDGDASMSIGYVRILAFGDKTVVELRKVLESLAGDAVRGLIIDLRDNAGGSLDAAVETCDLFLPDDKTIVNIRGRKGQFSAGRHSTGLGRYTQIPLVILINRNTASASEIVAACLQDHARAKIVGERTYGKGTVQHVIPVEAGHSILKLTAASYWRPSGSNIHRTKTAAENEEWGVQPDSGLKVELSDEELVELRKDRRRRDLFGFQDDERKPVKNSLPDRQLQKGVEVLKSLLTQGGVPPQGDASQQR